MDFSRTQLYGLRDINELKSLLGIESSMYFTPNCYVKDSKRLIESVPDNTKGVYSTIRKLLNQLEIPSYYHPVKKRSNTSAVHLHTKNSFFLELDIKGFFPNTSRDSIYRFFKNDLCQSPCVAKYLTDITTVNIEKTKASRKVKTFIEEKGYRKNHLITGAPCSSVLSFLVNERMFNAIAEAGRKKGMSLSVYVDDITFSSKQIIPFVFEQKIIRILHRNGYEYSKGKTFRNKKKGKVKILGVFVSNGKMTPQNRINKELKELSRDKNASVRDLKRKEGLENYTKQIFKANAKQ